MKEVHDFLKIRCILPLALMKEILAADAEDYAP